MNLLFFGAFGITLFQPPSMIYRFALIQDKSIPHSPGRNKIAAYCRKVTLVWMVFFVSNGTVAAWSIFSGSDAFWAVYNGGISYILMGVLFAGEFIIRKKVQKKMSKAVLLSAFNAKSRDPSMVMCYEGAWSDGVYKTWKDFLAGTAALRRQIEAIKAESWLLNCEDSWHFLLAFTALLQCKKEILLTANISPAYVEEIRGSAPFLTDKVYSGEGSPGGMYSISSLLNDKPVTAAPEEGPAINSEETSITMYTSGTTGKPKAVRQRLKEFESDNLDMFTRWGEAILGRKVCSTVSQHHIYGLLFWVLLPFTAGVPFRREMIRAPEELEQLRDTEYMIVTAPAFLKRAVEIESPGSLHLKSPWIFVSGGVLTQETAKKTEEVFGFWPVEVYGSTETSGIAWRQSNKGNEWTPLDYVRISVNQEGCLVVHSPYTKEPEGFETADMVEILPDGRFLLKGRIDSVVKIEEKRISLPEMENRILQSGLAADVCVIAMEDRRQYLAAALVFNAKGKERFDGLEKNEINKFWQEYLLQYFENLVIPKKWRYLEALPLDAQGKKKKEDITLLFVNEKPDTFPDSSLRKTGGFEALAGVKVIAKTENSLALEFSVPGSSPYFDGHFPGFLILPAAAQVELILRLAAEHLGIGIDISEIRRIKLSRPIWPDIPLFLSIEKQGKTVSFKMNSPDSKIVYSTGIITMRGSS